MSTNSWNRQMVQQPSERNSWANSIPSATASRSSRRRVSRRVSIHAKTAHRAGKTTSARISVRSQEWFARLNRALSAA